MLTTDSRRLETPPTSKSVEPQKLLQREGVFLFAQSTTTNWRKNE